MATHNGGPGLNGKWPAIVGVAIVVATLAFHTWLEYTRPGQRHEFLMIPLTVGGVLGWWGFYWMKPKQATKGLTVLLEATERFKKIKTGNREGDPEVVVKETTTSEVVIPDKPASGEAGNEDRQGTPDR